MLDKNTNKPAKMPSLQVDWEVYAQMLEASDWSDAQKREFIETIWSLVMTFVDLGYGVHPVQQACGESNSLDEIIKADMLSLPQSKSKTAFNKSANPQSGGKNKRSPTCKKQPKP